MNPSTALGTALTSNSIWFQAILEFQPYHEYFWIEEIDERRYGS
jgi:hypothetical protein